MFELEGNSRLHTVTWEYKAHLNMTEEHEGYTLKDPLLLLLLILLLLLLILFSTTIDYYPLLFIGIITINITIITTIINLGLL
jgi:hypothetical protein